MGIAFLLQIFPESISGYHGFFCFQGTNSLEGFQERAKSHKENSLDKGKPSLWLILPCRLFSRQGIVPLALEIPLLNSCPRGFMAPGGRIPLREFEESKTPQGKLVWQGRTILMAYSPPLLIFPQGRISPCYQNPLFNPCPHYVCCSVETIPLRGYPETYNSAEEFPAQCNHTPYNLFTLPYPADSSANFPWG